MQYFCVGMSLWDEERMKQNSKQARAPTDDVELPFCEGLEIISAAQLQQTPAVLTEAAAPVEAAPPIREPHRPGPTDRQAPPRVTQWLDMLENLYPVGTWPLCDQCSRLPMSVRKRSSVHSSDISGPSYRGAHDKSPSEDLSMLLA